MVKLNHFDSYFCLFSLKFADFEHINFADSFCDRPQVSARFALLKLFNGYCAKSLLMMESFTNFKTWSIEWFLV
jgi:hypothetical protein